MPRYVLETLNDRKAKYKELNFSGVREVIKDLDVLYMTRVQKERFPETPDGMYDYEKAISIYSLSKELLKEVKPEFKIMHPLPRINEIPYEVDETPYAYYFEQAGNGVPVRQAILSLVLGRCL